MPRNRFRRDFFPLQALSTALSNQSHDFFGERRGSRHQIDLRIFVMLGFTEQIRSHMRRFRIVIGHHQQLTGSGHHVDADGAIEQALRRRHIDIPGPTILSTFAIVFVPNAMAPIACTPPTR